LNASFCREIAEHFARIRVDGLSGSNRPYKQRVLACSCANLRNQQNLKRSNISQVLLPLIIQSQVSQSQASQEPAYFAGSKGLETFNVSLFETAAYLSLLILNHALPCLDETKEACPSQIPLELEGLGAYNSSSNALAVKVITTASRTLE
jgi:hypothetical protein